MIKVKGTKSAAPEATDTAQRYVLKSMDKVSHTPLAVGMLLTGLALYLKSVFSWARPEKAHSQNDDGDVGRAEPGMLPLQGPPMPIDTAAGSKLGPPPQDRTESGRRRADFDPSADEVFVDPSALHALRSALHPDWESHTPSLSRIHSAFDRATEKRADARDGGKPSEDRSDGNGDSDGDANADTDGNTDSDTDGSTDGDAFTPGSSEGPDGDTDSLEPATDDEDAADSNAGDGEGDSSDRDDVGNSLGNNRAPRVSGPVYLPDVAGCATLAIGLADLLRNAHDPDGDTLFVQDLTVSAGTLTQSETGWTFEGDARVPGPVTVTYQITDGELTVDQVAHFSVVRQDPIAGTAEDDMLLGSVCADEINGAAGNDNIDGRAGDDVIIGGHGDDHIVAGDGDDVVLGGDGNDIIFGGAGSDRLSGGNGDDALFGEGGDDVIFGDGGDDRLSGGEGRDLLSGGDGIDTVDGDAGDDTIEGGAGGDSLFGKAGHDAIDGGSGDDLIEGGAGDDILLDGAGRDHVLGGDGSDHVMAALDSHDDAYDGGGDRDTLDYSHATAGLVVDLVNDIAGGVEIGADSITGFEKVVGSRGDDHFILGRGSVAVAVVGSGGNDVFEFGNPDSLDPASHEIEDFDVGDQLRISGYDVFKKVSADPEEEFERIYGEGSNKNDLAIRYRHDRTDEMDRTVVETAFNNAESWATVVTLQGNHILGIVESA